MKKKVQFREGCDLQNVIKFSEKMGFLCENVKIREMSFDFGNDWRLLRPHRGRSGLNSEVAVDVNVTRWY